MLERSRQQLLSYTRPPSENPDERSAAISYSLHLALRSADGDVELLNDGSGVLFARSVVTERTDVRDVRTLREPCVFRTREGAFGVVALRCLADGSTDPEAAGAVLVFTSNDMLDFEERGLLQLPMAHKVRRPQVRYLPDAGEYELSWDDSSGPKGVRVSELDPTASAQPCTVVRTGAASRLGDLGDAEDVRELEIDDDSASRLRARLGRISNTAAAVQELHLEPGAARGTTVPVALRYSDGSTATLEARLDPAHIEAIDWSRSGVHTIRAVIEPDEHVFPFIQDRADPYILFRDGEYLFVATESSGNSALNRRLLIRRAPTLAGLPHAVDYEILTAGVAGIEGCFWAPELHEIGGALRLFFAPSIGAAAWTTVQCHVMSLRAGGDPTVAKDWSPPVPVLNQCGGALQLDAQHPGISLDMTCFYVGGVAYAAWSQRYLMGDEAGDAEVWIALLDAQRPDRLASRPVRLISPDRGWDADRAHVAEGPAAVEHDGKVFLTYAGSAVGPTYVTGLLVADADADLLDAGSWRKVGYPVLRSNVRAGEWGPGHSSFFTDAAGATFITYHAKLEPHGLVRHSTYRRVHWAADGMPRLDMSEEEQVSPILRSTRVVVSSPKGEQRQD